MYTKKLLPVLLSTLWILFPSIVYAQKTNSVTIGTKSVNLLLPQGFCVLEQGQLSDAALLAQTEASMAGQVRVLSIFADCQQLSDWRSGKKSTLDDSGVYITPINLINVDLPNTRKEFVGQFCTAIRGQVASPDQTQLLNDQIKQRVEQAFAGVQVNEQKQLGVLAEDEQACHAGLVQKMKNQTDEVKDILVIMSATVINGKLVFLNLYRKYENQETVDKLLAAQKNNIVAFIAINP